MEPKEKTSHSETPAHGSAQKPPANPEMEEFFSRFHEQMSHAQPGEAPLATALHALRELSLESDAEESVERAEIPGVTTIGLVCSACGARNREGHRFCSGCGVPLENARETGAKAGQHFYHHHYHHHYLSGDAAFPSSSSETRTPHAASSHAPSPKDFVRPRMPGAPMSRAEIAVRKVTQDWTLACNTKQIDDLMDLYSPDALLLRPNVPPVRSAASIREFFVSVLGAGMGEVEMDPVRVEIFGDTAYEAGRGKMLVPTVAGKRREERGKYLLFLAKQADGTWKILTDCWSNDLGVEK
ncbi:MAG TPA: DUF4440 domain-containing protein [Terriglobales bacterium]|jgi:uncharacterized protein (TIGR02246 family)